MLRLASLLLKLTALAALAVILALAWLRGPELWDRFAGDDAGESAAAAPDSAQAADVVRRYERLADGDIDRLVLTAPELESVLRYEIADRLPSSVSNPRIRLKEGEARVGLELPFPLRDSLPRPLGRIVPERVRSELTGVIVSTGNGEALFMLRRVELAGIPLPRDLAISLLRSFGDGGASEEAPEALPVELPPGVRAAYIEGDRLILEGRT